MTVSPDLKAARLFYFFSTLVLVLGALAARLCFAAPEEAQQPVTIAPATKEQLSTLSAFQKRLQSAGQIRSKVKRRTKVGLLGTEKIATGDLLVSKGRVRLDVKNVETQER